MLAHVKIEERESSFFNIRDEKHYVVNLWRKMTAVVFIFLESLAHVMFSEHGNGCAERKCVRSWQCWRYSGRLERMRR
jgi:hypothetical protein